ncbi:hypothetical protein ACFQAT_13810 [Undibacterium arcticum]|uniref:Uncharacterized protein n=1 Tax=Undibacterium arcticum TaxID=1762892 RepID=A0ABV7EX69_9BURK
MPHFEVELDRATGKGAGAGGTFQVVSITDESCVDRTSLIEKGKQYANLHELLVDIARAVGKGVGDLTLEEV